MASSSPHQEQASIRFEDGQFVVDNIETVDALDEEIDRLRSLCMQTLLLTTQHDAVASWNDLSLRQFIDEVDHVVNVCSNYCDTNP